MSFKAKFLTAFVCSGFELKIITIESLMLHLQTILLLSMYNLPLNFKEATTILHLSCPKQYILAALVHSSLK